MKVAHETAKQGPGRGLLGFVMGGGAKSAGPDSETLQKLVMLYAFLKN